MTERPRLPSLRAHHAAQTTHPLCVWDLPRFPTLEVQEYRVSVLFGGLCALTPGPTMPSPSNNSNKLPRQSPVPCRPRARLARRAEALTPYDKDVRDDPANHTLRLGDLRSAPPLVSPVPL